MAKGGYKNHFLSEQSLLSKLVTQYCQCHLSAFVPEHSNWCYILVGQLRGSCSCFAASENQQITTFDSFWRDWVELGLVSQGRKIVRTPLYPPFTVPVS